MGKVARDLFSESVWNDVDLLQYDLLQWHFRIKTIQLFITGDLVKIGPDSTNESSLPDYNDVIWGFNRSLKGTFMSPGLQLGHPYPF